MTSDLVRQLSEIDAGMIDDVGGKAANLGALISAGFPVPQGFCVTTAAYGRIAGAADSATGHFDSTGIAERIRRTPIPDDIAAGDHRQLPATRRAGARRGPLVGDRRGSAVRQLRRPAGHVPRDHR